MDQTTSIIITVAGVAFILQALRAQSTGRIMGKGLRYITRESQPVLFQMKIRGLILVGSILAVWGGYSLFYRSSPM